jgi:hypothetical protein
MFGCHICRTLERGNISTVLVSGELREVSGVRCEIKDFSSTDDACQLNVCLNLVNSICIFCGEICIGVFRFLTIYSVSLSSPLQFSKQHKQSNFFE